MTAGGQDIINKCYLH